MLVGTGFLSVFMHYKMESAGPKLKKGKFKFWLVLYTFAVLQEFKAS